MGLPVLESDLAPVCGLRHYWRYLPEKDCLTKDLKIYRSPKNEGEKLHPDFDYTVEDVICAMRDEMALTVEDVLARRTRILFLNARAAIDLAPKVAEIMTKELNKYKGWKSEQVKSFIETAQKYLVN